MRGFFEVIAWIISAICAVLYAAPVVIGIWIVIRIYGELNGWC